MLVEECYNFYRLLQDLVHMSLAVGYAQDLLVCICVFTLLLGGCWLVTFLIMNICSESVMF